MRFQVWDSDLPLCIVPQVYHFPEFVVWCAEHHAIDSRLVVTEKLSQLFITVSHEDIIKMLGLHTINFPEQNIVTLTEEILVQKFTSLTPQVQLSFVQGIQRYEYIISTLEFPVKVDTCPTPIQQIVSMYCQVFGLYHDQTISEAFLGFLMYFSESIKFDYPNLIANTMHDQFSNFNTLASFKYQLYLMYLILDKFSLHFQSLLEPEELTPYDVISIIHRSPFLRNQTQGFSKFVNEFASQVYLFIYEANYPRISQQLQNCLHPPTEDHIGDWFMFKDYTIIRVYGLEEKPYIFPVFLTPWIFALEVLRQRLHSDELHFSSKKQTSTFKVPITIGTFTVRNKVVVELIDDIMAYYGFLEEPSCQYDSHHLISKRRKKQKRGNYEHHGTQELELMANKLTFLYDQEKLNEPKNMDITPLVLADDKGKRKIGQQILTINTSIPTSKKPKIVKDPFLQVVEYPTPTMELAKGKEIGTEKTILEHYSSLKAQASKERELTEERLRSTQPPQLISALDKRSQLMKITVIQPPRIGDPQNKKITGFKLNMSQFSVVDKVDFLKQTSEIIFSNLIRTIVSKDKLFRDFKKLENKLKIEQAEKKALQIKKSELEKKIMEINKGAGNDTINTLILKCLNIVKSQ